MPEEVRTLPENIEDIHGGYFLVIVNGNSHRWLYRYEGALIVSSNRAHGSMEKCVAEIEIVRTCAEAPVYVDD